MDAQIMAILALDGLTTGAVYALLALALVMVFSVTRVIFIPQGEFVAFGALTLASIQAGQAPMISWLLAGMGAMIFVHDVVALLRNAELRRQPLAHLVPSAGKYLLFPIAVHLLAQSVNAKDFPLLAQAALAMLIVVPMGPMLYRIAFERLAEASTLVLLIVAVSVHLVLLGFGLVFFGAEGSRTEALSELRVDLMGIPLSGQSMSVMGVAVILIVALYFFFDRSYTGKALRATAVNRLGAKLMGIGTAQAGRLSFTLAAAVGVLCGILIAPMTTVYYDTGFLIALKGFVAAIVGGLASYPMAAVGAVLVGLLESYSSFGASAYKEVIVFTMIIPVLLWRSLTSRHADEH